MQRTREEQPCLRSNSRPEVGSGWEWCMSSSSECGTPHACSNTICSSAVPGLERRRDEYCRAACHEIMLRAAWSGNSFSSTGQCASVQRRETALVRQGICATSSAGTAHSNKRRRGLCAAQGRSQTRCQAQHYVKYRKAVCSVCGSWAASAH